MHGIIILDRQYVVVVIYFSETSNSPAAFGRRVARFWVLLFFFCPIAFETVEQVIILIFKCVNDCYTHIYTTKDLWLVY